MLMSDISFVIIGLFAYILILGGITSRVVKARGLNSNWFWAVLFIGLPALLLVVIAIPPRHPEKTNTEINKDNEYNDLTKSYGHLSAGSRYLIIKSFRDYDNYPYEKGGTIMFFGSSFHPYEGGLTLFCVYNERKKQIRLQIQPDAQEEIAHNLEKYFELISE